MLAKKERLSRDAFNRFFSVGKRLHSPSFTLVYAPHTTFHGAVVVSKKVASRAVKRNILRRRVYSLLYTHKEHGATGVYIVILRKTPQIPTHATLKGELNTLLAKLTATN
jgi:ribonuclease P protein component